jgi:hypothetical protein
MPNPGPANERARCGGRVGTTPPSRHYAVLRILGSWLTGSWLTGLLGRRLRLPWRVNGGTNDEAVAVPCRLTNDVSDQCITDLIIVAAYGHLVN